MIIFKILDKCIDIATAVEHYKSRLFYNPKEIVYNAQLAFTVIGGFISVAKISLYSYRIYLNCTGDKSRDKCYAYDDFNPGMQSIKVVFEAFPKFRLCSLSDKEVKESIDTWHVDGWKDRLETTVKLVTNLNSGKLG